jgi:DNA-binding LytR/AlgR family response regulator
MGGFQLMAQLRGSQLPAVIIVTAYDEHAIQAFETGAVDYLLKPVREARLRQALERAGRLLGHPQELAENLARIQSVITPESPVRRAPKIIGKSGEEFFLLKVDEVLAFQADGDLTWILTHKRRYLATENLKSLQGKLYDSGFRRVHRNALVNIEAIRKLSVITSQRWMITLTNGQEFIVSKRQAKNIRDVLHG